MNDLIVIALTIVFFAIAVSYVALCDRIIGPDPEPMPDGGGSVETSDDGDVRVDATVEPVTR